MSGVAFTEDELAQSDQECERLDCSTIIKAGERRYFVATIKKNSVASKWTCKPCHAYYEDKRDKWLAPRNPDSKPVTATTSTSAAAHPRVFDTRAIDAMVNLSQRKGSTREERTAHSLPPVNRGSMGPPSRIPPRPNVNIPSSWGASSSSQSYHGTRAIGYSSAHAQHANANNQWKSLAYAPGEHYEIRIHVHHEIVQVKNKYSLPLGNLIEGKKVFAHASGAEIAKLVMELMVPKLMAYTNNYPWDTSRFTVRDANHVNLAEETGEGYFRDDCIKPVGKDKKLTWVKPKTPFSVFLYVDLEQHAEYIEHEEQKELEDTFTSQTTVSDRKDTTRRKGKEPKHESQLDALFTEKASRTSSRTLRSATPSQVADSASYNLRTAHFTSPLESMDNNMKRQRSESTTSTTTQPRSKRQEAYRSPDRSSIRDALIRGGSSTNLDLSNFNGLSLRIEYQPIVSTPLAELLKIEGGMAQFTESASMTQGTLYINTRDRLGLGGFKTANPGRLTLSPLSASGELGHVGNQEVAVKRFYYKTNVRIDKTTGEEKFTVTRFSVAIEREKTLTEAGILYWAISLLDFAYSYIDKVCAEWEALEKSGEASSLVEPGVLDLLHCIPNVRFVNAGVAIVFDDSAASTSSGGGTRSSNIREMYILEDIIPMHEAEFTKYIHNADPDPLCDDENDPEYDIGQFLSAVQHILYHKTGGLVYISDFQGVGDLLTDPQLMTSEKGVFGEGNIQKAVHAFPKRHVCTDYCKLFRLDEFATG